VALNTPVRWQEETAPGRGVKLHVRRVVEPAAPPVLLLHGLGAGGVVFQNFARRLLPYLAAVAPDLRGHGESDAPASGYAPNDYALDLIAVAQDSLDAPLPLVGHSLGAMVGLEMAALRPDLVKWLVLLDPPLDPELRNPEIGDVYRLRDAAPGELEAYLLERNPGGGELLANFMARLFRQANDAAFEAMLGREAFPIQRVRVPILLIQADPTHGGVLSDASARAAAEALGDAKLIKLEGASHTVHASRPNETARAILEFGGYSSEGVSSR
jgi:pimeloyl-ACP methyl ester carboxylesterase